MLSRTLIHSISYSVGSGLHGPNTPRVGGEISNTYTSCNEKYRTYVYFWKSPHLCSTTLTLTQQQCVVFCRCIVYACLTRNITLNALKLWIYNITMHVVTGIKCNIGLQTLHHCFLAGIALVWTLFPWQRGRDERLVRPRDNTCTRFQSDGW